MNPSSSLSSWYRPEDRGAQNGDVATNAFRAAAERFTDLVAKDQKNGIEVKGDFRLGDIYQMVVDAKSSYDTGSLTSSKAAKWLQRLSISIHHYSNIFDVLIQHHPEYVALAWGAMKLLFVGVVNHEKTVTLLAKSLAEIAERLPRWEIKSQLYQTARMREALEEAYALILEFLCRAHSWYNESRTRRVIHSITQPPELRYSDLLQSISDCSSNIDQIAIVGSQAELRDVHNELRKARSIISALSIRSEGTEQTVRDILSAITSFQAIHTSTLIDTNQRVSHLELSHIMLEASQVSMADPNKCYQHHLFFRDRRVSSAGVKVSTNRFWLSPMLKDWSLSEQSALIAVQGSFLLSPALQDFSVSVIQQLREANVPVLWALRGSHPTDQRSNSITDLLKYLIVQIIHMSQELQTEKDLALRCSQLHTPRAVQEWFELFKRAIQGLDLRQMYLVLDLETLDHDGDSEESFELLLELQKWIPSLSMKLKIVVITSSSNWSSHSSYELYCPTVAVTATRQGKERRRTKHPRRGYMAGITL